MPSHWAETKTFFPLLLAELEKKNLVGTACIVGASDGKFVVPLANRGWHIVALEIDTVALFGGQVEYPRGTFTSSLGLHGRISEASVEKNVEIVHEDLYDFKPSKQFDVVFTSCSWHYSRNHHRRISEYIGNMQNCVAPGGIFCAEFMMPVEPKHFLSEHYLYEGQIRQYFAGWSPLEEFYTAPFWESSHLGNLDDHVHQMGFFMAEKPAPLA